jgi:hypothetical protein
MGCSCSNFDQEEPTSNNKQAVCHDYTESPDTFAGDGIKRTKAWQGTISNGQLRERREEFWRSRKEGNRDIWRSIRQAIEADHESAPIILDMSQITHESNSLSVCYDSTGFRYEIPVWVINDPVKFSGHELISQMNKILRASTTAPSDSDLELKLRTVSNPQDVTISISNAVKVKLLKQMYCKQKNLSVGSIRLFFGGKELNDDSCISDYNLENGMVIQVFIKKSI